MPERSVSYPAPLHQACALPPGTKVKKPTDKRRDGEILHPGRGIGRGLAPAAGFAIVERAHWSH